MIRRHLANGVSLSRIILIVPWILANAAGSWLAPVILVLIIVTDLIDGPIARRLGTANGREAVIDAGSDAAVVIIGAFVLGTGDTRYFLLAALMVLAFGSWYAGQSEQVRIGMRGDLGYTHLGRYNGVLCYGAVFFGNLVRLDSPLPGTVIREVLAAAEIFAASLTGILLIISTRENLRTLHTLRGMQSVHRNFERS